jgi:hypothetical protein
MKTLFELKRFKSSRDKGIIDALRLYVDYTEPAVRTDSKEILYCLDHWNDLFTDPFFVLSLYLNGEIIGFTELAFFVEEKFVIVDYLVIDKRFRKNNTFFQFIEGIQEFLRKEGIEYNYIVAEVACYHDNLEPPESSRLLIRLLKMSHFGVIKCNYYVPRVGIFDYESEMRAVMMIYSQNDARVIKKDTFFQIVNAIYKKYYQRWHNLFVGIDEKMKYDTEINFLLDKMEKQLASRNTIEINGLSGLFPIKTNFEYSSTKNKLLKIVTALGLFVICFLVVATFFTLLKTRLGWDSSTASTIIISSISLTLFIIALLFEKKSNVFSKSLEKILEKL